MGLIELKKFMIEDDRKRIKKQLLQVGS